MTDFTLQTRQARTARFPTLALFAEKTANSFGVVRLVAAIAVIVTHAYGVVGGMNAAEPLHASTGLSLGAHAVHVFFALSGFMVMASWERSSGWLDFALARALRVMPALICVNVAIVVIGGLFLTSAAPADYWTVGNVGIFLVRTVFLFAVGTPLEGVFADTPMPGFINIPIWTIRFEILCYASLFVVMAAIGILRFKGMARLGPVLAVIALTALLIGRAQDYSELSFIEQMARFAFAFYLGVAAWIARRWVMLNGAIALVLGAVAALFVQAGSGAGLPLMILATAYGSFWLGSLQMGWVQRRTAATDLSYGAYIIGFFIQQWLIEAFPGIGAYTNMVLATAIVLPLAWLSWTFVEKPALRLRKRLSAKLD